MAIQLQGNGGTVVEADGSLFRALRIAAKPIDHAALGHYRLCTTIPLVVTQAVNGTLFSWRWGDATRIAVLTKLRISCMQTAIATATIAPRFQAFMARTFTVADSVGTAITTTGNSMKKRTNMGTSLVSDIRKSAVLAGLTVGTRTLDGDPFMELPTQQTITTMNQQLYERELDIGMGDGNHPYVFAQNEGFVVKGPTIVFGAAGTADLVVDMSWTELGAF